MPISRFFLPIKAKKITPNQSRFALMWETFYQSGKESGKSGKLLAVLKKVSHPLSLTAPRD